MKIGKSRPVIPSVTVIYIKSNDWYNNNILSSLTKEFINYYPDVKTYKLINDKDKDFKMVFSPAMFDKYLQLLKSFITNNNKINEHDNYQAININISLKLESLDSDYYLKKEISLKNFENITISDSFTNISLLLNQLIFFKLDDDISNLEVTNLYNSNKDIAKAFIDNYLVENKQFFHNPIKDSLIATYPSKSDFAKQNTDSVFIPAFNIENSNDNEDKKDDDKVEHPKDDDKVESSKNNQSENQKDDDKVEVSKNNQSENLRQIEKNGNAGDTHSNDISLDEMLKKEMPFIPEKLINKLQKHEPKYLFEVHKNSLDKYADIKDAIKFGRFDAQQYLVSYNNSFKNYANNQIRNQTSELANDFISEITGYINKYSEQIRKADEKAYIDLSDNNDIKKQTNKYFQEHFINTRKPELLDKKEEVKKYKKERILKKAYLEIDEMEKDVDNEFEEKINNAYHMTYSKAESIANQKMEIKKDARDKVLIQTKQSLSQKLFNDIQSIYNNFVVRVDKLSYIMFKEFNTQLNRKQPVLIENISSLIGQQTTLNESVVKMYKIKYKNEHNENKLIDNSDIKQKEKEVSEEPDENASYKEKYENIRKGDTI
ncbi:hypothetical protein DY052_06005 [Apilactobacillus timberlakei]|uniref:hypothetical protein n=1 Tax=Apilactobacillus timberlakei TaxID=2008380 RepID=UPI001129C0BA|nr:hypothetical protein [Apilactobacillus timberlakei]TPR14977.1 hypothetical protein DY052_06005 [Apilactobacillus timberlakei]